MTGRHSSASRYEYHTSGFVAAQPGWQLVFLTYLGKVVTHDLPGWLIQDEVAYDRWGEPEDERSWPARRVVAATLSESAELEPVTDVHRDEFWYVASPSDTPPTEEEIAAALELREAQRRGSEFATSNEPTTVPTAN